MLAGHVFISYVRENSREVDYLQHALESAGIRVWRDTADLWPGEDWRAKIRHAITNNALVFIACFSRESITRELSYQNEELILAIEQLRLRRPDDPWLIPVRFDDCDIPELEIGAGRTLASIQRADLFGDRSDENAARLVATVLRILKRYSTSSGSAVSTDMGKSTPREKRQSETPRPEAALKHRSSEAPPVYEQKWWQRKAEGAVGIDLGTTNSAIAVMVDGEPVVVANAEGSRTTPSVVAFAMDGRLLVGEAAKRQAVTNVNRTIRSVKRLMGTDWTVKIDDKKFIAQQINAFILQKLRRDAEAYLGAKIIDVVITAPAHFNDAQRQATKEAGQIAGLNVLRIINEPTSAALAYHLEKENEATILVFDLGGGTFDVSLLRVGNGVVEVNATSGDNHLGGDDWDQRIVDWLVQDFKNGYGIDLSKDDMALQRLLEAAEKAKIELSSSTEAQISLPYTRSERVPLHMSSKLTSAEFQHITSDLLDRCNGPFKQVLKDAGVRQSNIDHVVLVGGSTRMPAVVNLVKELTGGKEPNKSVNPDEVIAVGACLQAGQLKAMGQGASRKG